MAPGDRIKKGEVTDVYFIRDVEVLAGLGIDRRVKAEVRAATLPEDWEWAVLAGVEEVATLLQGMPVNVVAMDEGVFFGAETPVLTIEGRYTDWAVYETAILGFLCQASGVATRAARCKSAAGPRGLFSFGARRMHPAAVPMIERAAFIGGCDGVSTTIGAELIGEEAVGTMPHALIITIGDEVAAFKAFDAIMPPNVKRVALVDTFNDEKFGALIAADTLGDHLQGVRLDTPKSRRGDFLKIAKEVRWELEIRGYEGVRIFASGGLDEWTIEELNEVVDSYGVGGYISNAPIVDFSLDIIEVEGEAIAKRGKMAGAKQAWRCSRCASTEVTLSGRTPGPCCEGGLPEPLLGDLIGDGRIIRQQPAAREIREKVMEQLPRYAR